MRFNKGANSIDINTDGFPALRSNTGETYSLLLVGLVKIFGGNSATMPMKLTVNEPFTCDDDPVRLATSENLIITLKWSL